MAMHTRARYAVWEPRHQKQAIHLATACAVSPVGSASYRITAMLRNWLSSMCQSFPTCIGDT